MKTRFFCLEKNLQWGHTSRSKQNGVVANRLAELMNTIDLAFGKQKNRTSFGRTLVKRQSTWRNSKIVENIKWRPGSNWFEKKLN